MFVTLISVFKQHNINKKVNTGKLRIIKLNFPLKTKVGLIKVMVTTLILKTVSKKKKT